MSKGFLSGAKAQGKAGAVNKPASANKPADRSKNKTVGRYSGLGAAAPRLPFLKDGRYRVKVLKTYDYDGRNQDWFRAELEVLAAAEGSHHKVGDQAIYNQCVTKGDALAVGGPRVISFTMTAMGYDSEAEFCEAFPEESQARDDLMNRVSGVDLDETEIGENPLAGAVLMVQATGTGKVDAKTGEEYQNYVWFPNEEDGEEAAE